MSMKKIFKQWWSYILWVFILCGVLGSLGVGNLLFSWQFWILQFSSLFLLGNFWHKYYRG